MSKIVKLAIGGDYDVTVEFPLPIASYQNLAVWFVDKKCEPFKYSLIPLAEHNSDDVSVISENEILIRLQKSATAKIAAGIVTIETYEAIADAGREDAHFAEIALPTVFAEFRRNRIFRAWK